MKKTVTYSCGHEGQIELFGKGSERERKIAWYENQCLCHECYKAEKEEERKRSCVEIEMPYREYKNTWSHCFTKAKSYNPEKKTVVVYIKKGEWEAKAN